MPLPSGTRVGGMPSASKVYTNADLRTKTPQDVYGPTRMVTPASAKALEDYARGADINGGMSADDVIAEVKRYVGGEGPRFVNVADRAKSLAGEHAAAERLSPMGQAKEYGGVALDAAKGAAVPASFLGGPVGMAAGAGLTALGLHDAVEDPSVKNIGFAAMGLLPFLRPARNLMREGQAAKTVGEVERFMPNESASRFARRPSEGGYVAGSKSGGPVSSGYPTPYHIGDEATNALESTFGRPMGPSPTNARAPYHVGDTAVEARDSLAGSEFGRPVGPLPEGNYRSSYVGHQDVPGAAGNYRLPNSAQALLQQTEAAMPGVGEVLPGMRGPLASRLDAEPQAAVFRAANAHGMGGFSGTPNMSPEETSRIEAMIEALMQRR